MKQRCEESVRKKNKEKKKEIFVFFFFWFFFRVFFFCVIQRERRECYNWKVGTKFLGCFVSSLVCLFFYKGGCEIHALLW